MNGARPQRDAMDFEAPIAEAYGASLALESWANDTFAAKRERDAEGFFVFRLTDDQIKILFFLLYATLDQTRALYRLFHGDCEVES